MTAKGITSIAGHELGHAIITTLNGGDVVKVVLQDAATGLTDYLIDKDADPMISFKIALAGYAGQCLTEGIKATVDGFFAYEGCFYDRGDAFEALLDAHENPETFMNEKAQGVFDELTATLEGNKKLFDEAVKQLRLKRTMPGMRFKALVAKHGLKA